RAGRSGACGAAAPHVASGQPMPNARVGDPQNSRRSPGVGVDTTDVRSLDREHPSTPASVSIALGDGGRCGGQNSSSSSMNSVGSKWSSSSSSKASVPMFERLPMLLQLLQLLDDLAHIDSGTTVR